MLRRPPRSKRTGARCPDTTLFRSSAPPPLRGAFPGFRRPPRFGARVRRDGGVQDDLDRSRSAASDHRPRLEAASGQRSEEHTSELQSLMRISYAVFCLKKKHNTIHQLTYHSPNIITYLIPYHIHFHT